MKTVYKYTLNATESNVIELPLSIQILSVETKDDDIVVYGLVDTEEIETDSYDFRTYGTGHEINVDVKDYKFLGTAKMDGGSLMFHIFYKQLAM